MARISTEHALEQLARVFGREFGCNRHIPQPRIGACRAFYGIFFRHEYGQAITESQIGDAQRMMIRKCMLGELDATRAQLAEEAPGITGAGHRVHVLAAEVFERLRRRPRIDAHGMLWPHRHDERALRQALQRWMPGRPVHYQYVGARKARERLAQRARGQQAPITKSAHAVDDDDLAVARQTQMLQAVIGQDDIDAARQGARRRQTVGGNNGRTPCAPGDDHRLIPDLAPRGAGTDRTWIAVGGTAVTARDNADRQAEFAQLARQPDGQRSLAGSTDREVAHDHDRFAGPSAAQPARRVGAGGSRAATSEPYRPASGCRSATPARSSYQRSLNQRSRPTGSRRQSENCNRCS